MSGERLEEISPEQAKKGRKKKGAAEHVAPVLDPLPPKDPPSEDQDKTGPKKPKPQSQAGKIVDLVLASRAELFQTPEGKPYATITKGNHRETHPIGGSIFGLHLRHIFYLATGEGPSGEGLSGARSTLEAIATHGDSHSVNRRIAEGEDGRIYIDLCDKDWRVVSIGPDGWKVLPESPVKFSRTKGMQALPVPAVGGTMGDLRPFVNVEKDGWPLVLAWLVAACWPRGPFPILGILGGQGCAKSCTSKALRRCIDPNQSDLRRLPKDPKSLFISANNARVLVLNNLSSIPDEMSDQLCCIATGGGSADRSLYSDDEETIFDVQKPIIMNGIGAIMTRSDLLDRAVVLHAPVIDQTKRKEERELWPDFERALPRILGALYSALAGVLRDLAGVRLTSRPRMADFARLAVAAEPHLGLKKGDFLAAYETSQNDANDTALESVAFVKPLLDLVNNRGGRWNGSANDLHAVLDAAQREKHGKDWKPPREWPANGQSLSTKLQRIAPNLAASGQLVVTTTRMGKKRTRSIDLSGPGQGGRDRTRRTRGGRGRTAWNPK